MNIPVIILGAGGHAKVLIDVLLLNSLSILGITDTDPQKVGTQVSGVRVIGSDEVIQNYQPESIHLVNGIGSVRTTTQRKRVFERFKKLGYTFKTVVHPSSIIARDVRIEEGAQIMAGAVIQPGCTIGLNTIINTGAIIDHDCRVGAHVHMAPGAILSGGVNIADQVHVGTAASVIQGISIGKSSFVAAGAVVVDNVPANKQIMGIPGKSSPKGPEIDELSE